MALSQALFYTEHVIAVLTAVHHDRLPMAEIAERFHVDVETVDAIVRWDRYLKSKPERRLPASEADVAKFKPGRGRILSPELVAELAKLMETMTPNAVVERYGVNWRIAYAVKRGTYAPSDPHSPRGQLRHSCQIRVPDCAPSNCRGRHGGYRTSPEVILEVGRRIAAGQTSMQIRRECHVTSSTVARVRRGEHPLLEKVKIRRRRYMPTPDVIERMCAKFRKLRPRCGAYSATVMCAPASLFNC